MTPTREQNVVAPTLDELRSRQCSLEELQAVIVKLIDLHNAQAKATNEALNRKQDRLWRATI